MKMEIKLGFRRRKGVVVFETSAKRLSYFALSLLVSATLVVYGRLFALLTS